MKKYPLISVIVPVYNVEQYLRQCLDSVLNQTYQEIEVLLIMMVRQMLLMRFVGSMRNVTIVFVIL